MLGFVPNEQTRRLVGESKALILPTQVYEGFPMTIAESYAAGTPVIGSDLGNTGSLIENGTTGWKFAPKSSEELAEAVLKIRNSYEGMDEDKIQKYSAEKNYEQLRRIYETCCNYH
jgi:glycosyltransferase involved in cell wall biosynthesis